MRSRTMATNKHNSSKLDGGKVPTRRTAPEPLTSRKYTHLITVDNPASICLSSPGRLWPTGQVKFAVKCGCNRAPAAAFHATVRPCAPRAQSRAGHLPSIIARPEVDELSRAIACSTSRCALD